MSDDRTMSPAGVHDPSCVFETIRSRRSVRRYDGEPVPPDMVRALLDAATWAPSAHNRQPWRFAVIADRAVQHELATEMGARLRADLEADGVAPAIIDKDVQRSYDRLTSAPLLIVVCMTMIDMDRYPDEIRQHNEWVMATQGVAMAGQNLLLSAHALGLGACWMCAPLFAQDVVRLTLDLPADWEPQGLITVGFPAETREKTREPLARRVRVYGPDEIASAMGSGPRECES